MKSLRFTVIMRKKVKKTGILGVISLRTAKGFEIRFLLDIAGISRMNRGLDRYL